MTMWWPEPVQGEVSGVLPLGIHSLLYTFSCVLFRVANINIKSCHALHYAVMPCIMHVALEGLIICQMFTELHWL